MAKHMGDGSWVAYYIYIYVYVYVYVFMYTCIYIYTYICIYTYMYTAVYAFMCIFKCTCTMRVFQSSACDRFSGHNNVPLTSTFKLQRPLPGCMQIAGMKDFLSDSLVGASYELGYLMFFGRCCHTFLGKGCGCRCESSSLGSVAETKHHPCTKLARQNADKASAKLRKTKQVQPSWSR